MPRTFRRGKKTRYFVTSALRARSFYRGRGADCTYRARGPRKSVARETLLMIAAESATGKFPGDVESRLGAKITRFVNTCEFH
jgi:hypothetical protein